MSIENGAIVPAGTKTRIAIGLEDLLCPSRMIVSEDCGSARTNILLYPRVGGKRELWARIPQKRNAFSHSRADKIPFAISLIIHVAMNLSTTLIGDAQFFFTLVEEAVNKRKRKV